MKTEVTSAPLKQSSSTVEMIDQLVKIPVTSAAISVVTMPIQGALAKLAAGGPLLPKEGNRLLLAASFFKGVRSNLIAGQKKGAVSITAKTSQKATVEEVELSEPATEHKTATKDLHWTRHLNMVAPLAFSQADMVVSQAFINKSKLEAIGTIKPNYKLTFRNGVELLRAGYFPKSCASLANFSSLMLLSGVVTRQMPFESKAANNFAGGALTGAFAAVCCYLPNTLADQVVVATKVLPNGQIERVKTLDFFRQQAKAVQAQGIIESLFSMAKAARVQLPLRTVQTMVVFSMIQGIDHLMGEKPVSGWLGNDLTAVKAEQSHTCRP